MNLFLKCLCLVIFSSLVACTKPVDLDAPCPEFGRYCPQAPINAWDNDEKIQ